MKLSLFVVVLSGALLVGCHQAETPEDKDFFNQMSTKNPPKTKGGPKKADAAATDKTGAATADKGGSPPSTSGTPPATTGN